MIKGSASSAGRLARARATLHPIILVCSAPIFGGCFFDDMQRSDENDIRRVEQKQSALQVQQDKSASLKAQQDELEHDLRERQFSLGELNERVRNILSANSRSLADNEATHARYQELLDQVCESNEQLTAVREDQGSPASIEEKRERVARLTQKLRAQLDILLH